MKKQKQGRNKEKMISCVVNRDAYGGEVRRKILGK